jgi:hypothetical protein
MSAKAERLTVSTERVHSTGVESSSRRSSSAPVRRETQKHLGDHQGDDLSVGRLSFCVFSSLWQKVISCAINDGVERGLMIGCEVVADRESKVPLPRAGRCHRHEAA